LGTRCQLNKSEWQVSAMCDSVPWWRAEHISIIWTVEERIQDVCRLQPLMTLLGSQMILNTGDAE
jgi:hypothetical protein